MPGIDLFVIQENTVLFKPASSSVGDVYTSTSGFIIENGSNFSLDPFHLMQQSRKMQSGNRIENPHVPVRPCRMHHAGNIIQRTDRHASKMEALPPDPPLPNELDFFSGTGKPDRCNPACRPTPEDSYHGEFLRPAMRLVFVNKKLVRIFPSYSCFRILPGKGICLRFPCLKYFNALVHGF